MGLCVVIRLVDAVFRTRTVMVMNGVLCVDHRCNVTMISATGLVTKELVEAGDQHMVRLAEHPLFARRV